MIDGKDIAKVFGPRCAEFDPRCGSCLMWRAHDEIARLTYERDLAELSRDAAHAEYARLSARLAECEGLSTACDDFQAELRELRASLSECEGQLRAVALKP